jgi:RimJ/RimL family protein N-acetyltransferase
LIEEQGWGFWAVELKADGSFIGFLGLNVPAPNLPFSPCVEIGWRLALRYWGQGYASEGAREALRFGFQTLQLEEIVAFTALTNGRSQAVMRRIGMRERGERFAHPALPPGHALREHCLMRLSREEWIGLRSHS